MKTLVLSSGDVKSILSMDIVIPAVEEAFKAHGRREVIMPPKVYIPLEQYNGDFRAMPSFLMGSAGVKWVNAHPQNPKRHNLPAVLAILILSDPKTALPLAIMDATQITNFRTGAAGAIASKYLAKKDSSLLGLIGCGVQAQTQLLAISKVFNLKEVLIFDISKNAMDNFTKNNPDLPIKKVSLREACSADIVCTTTPSREPVVKREWIKRATHINAIGADGPGKQELDPIILKDAKIVLDDFAQGCHSGEVNVPLSKGLLKKEEIYATLGEIVAGIKKGREADEITIFDSTGLAIQDIAVARVIYEEAKRRGVGQEIDMVGL